MPIDYSQLKKDAEPLDYSSLKKSGDEPDYRILKREEVAGRDIVWDKILWDRMYPMEGMEAKPAGEPVEEPIQRISSPGEQLSAMVADWLPAERKYPAQAYWKEELLKSGARVAAGTAGWYVDLAVNPPKAIADFGKFLWGSGGEWNKLRKTIMGDEQARDQLATAFTDMPVEEVLLFLGLPLALFGGVKGGLKLKAKMGKPQATALVEELIKHDNAEEAIYAKETPSAGSEILPQIEAQRQAARFDEQLRVRDIDANRAERIEGTVGKEPQAAQEVVRPKTSPLEAADIEYDNHKSYYQDLSAGTEELLADMDAYQNFKDVEVGILGGSKPVDFFAAEIDGALPLEAKAKLPYQAGPVERGVYWPTQDMTMAKMRWADAETQYLQSIFKDVSKVEDVAITGVLQKMSRKGAYVDATKLIDGPVGKVPDVSVKVIEKAQQLRKWYEHTFKQQNVMRAERGQNPIEYRNRYSPEIIREMTLRERLFGYAHTLDEFKSQVLPDFINRWPNKPFNPRELARDGGIPDMIKEMRASKLAESYANSAARDIFDTSIIRNNKAVANKLSELGFSKSSAAIQDWTAEAYGHIPALGDRVTLMHTGAGYHRFLSSAMHRIRMGYARGAFPLNISWNAYVQSSSAALTIGKYGTRNSMMAVLDWFGNPKLRRQIASTYAATMKSAGRGDPAALLPRFASKTGSITRQDVNAGISRLVSLTRGKMETATDALNYITETTERTLTGWSIAAGLRQGRAAGLTGEALWRYASDAGAKTQSMYNYENLPGVLRSTTVKTGGPFQTFSFSVWNLMKEWAGKTGTPVGGKMARVKAALRFVAATTAVNYIAKAAISRKPWELSSFIPFYSIVFEPIERALRGEWLDNISSRSGLPSTSGILIDLINACRSICETGDMTKARRWLIRNVPGWIGIPGGTQANRIVDGILAITAGEVANSKDETMFDVDELQDQIRAVFGGIWTTKQGEMYWDDRKKELRVLPHGGMLGDLIEHIPVVGDILEKKEGGWWK